MTRTIQDQRTSRRLSVLDHLHVGAILICTIWTAKVITEESPATINVAANLLTRIAWSTPHTSNSVTIRLEEGVRSASR